MAPTDPMEILQIINSLKSKKTLGPDRISTHLLKEIGPEICTVLSMAVNKSISSGIVPSLFMFSLVLSGWISITYYNYYFDILFYPVTIFRFTERGLGQHSVLNLYPDV